MGFLEIAYLAWVTIRLWLFWGCGAAIIGYWLHYRGYDRWDAALGGLGGMWIVALVFGFWMWLWVLVRS